MTYSDIIKQLCEKKGISMRKLESDLGYTNGYLRSQKDNIKTDKLEDVAKYFGVKPFDIVTLKLQSDFKESDDRLNEIIANGGFIINDEELSEPKMIIEPKEDRHIQHLIEYIYRTEAMNFDKLNFTNEDKCFISVFKSLKPKHQERIVDFLKEYLVEELETETYKKYE